MIIVVVVVVVVLYGNLDIYNHDISYMSSIIGSSTFLLDLTIPREGGRGKGVD